MLTDIYLAYWVNQSPSEQDKMRAQNIIIFVTGSFTINLFIILRTLNSFIAGLRAAKIMFINMLNSLLDASIPLYYDVNPMGRILNRLSKDQNSVDTTIPRSSNFTLSQLFTAFYIILFCLYTVPIVLISIPFALYLALKVQKFYLASSRDLTRIESMSKSPIVHQFSETLNGLSTIRAFGYQKQFVNKYYALIDKNISLLFYKSGCSC